MNIGVSEGIRTIWFYSWCKSLVCNEMERVKGIEPSSQAWEARILPLDHTRVTGETSTTPAIRAQQGNAGS